MKHLYVCSSLIPDNNGTLSRHLIGILTLTDQNTYEFRYALDDSPLCTNLMLPIFPDKDKTYDDTETRVLLDDYLPSETDTAFMQNILSKSEMKEYNEWEWLRTFESDDPDSETRLYETLPDNVIRHDHPITLEKDVISTETLDAKQDTDPVPDDIDYADEDNYDEIIAYDNADLMDVDEIDNTYDFDIEDPIDNDSNISDDTDFDPFSELSDEDFDIIDKIISKSAENTTENITTIQPVQSAPAEPVPEEIISPSQVKEHKYPQLTSTKHSHKTITITTTHRISKNIIPKGDFIEAPPESPVDLIEQRLRENQKQRQERLQAQLNNTI